MEIDSWDQIVIIDESQSSNFDQYLIIYLLLHHFPTVDNPDPNLMNH